MEADRRPEATTGFIEAVVEHNSHVGQRPDALSAIRFDPIPLAAPITPDQMARVLDQLSPDGEE